MKDIDHLSTSDQEKLSLYLAWNSFYSERHKLLYIATPKVACTSLKWWFAELEGYAETLREIKNCAESDTDLIIHENFHKVAPTVTGLSIDVLRKPLISNDYFKFAVVRNPYTRIFSAWQSKLLLRSPFLKTTYEDYDFYNKSIKDIADIAAAFQDFLEYLVANESPNFLDVHWTPQVDLLRPDLIDYTCLMKIENAKDLSASLYEWLGYKFIDPFSSKNLHENLIPYLPELITPKSAELIHLLYNKDFSTFGYSEEIPQAKVIFSSEQFKIAIKAIEILRRRHQRFSEMADTFTKQSILINEQTKIIDDLTGIIKDHTKTIANQTMMLDQQIKRLAEISTSLSWRITRPLRGVARLIRNLKGE